MIKLGDDKSTAICYTVIYMATKDPFSYSGRWDSVGLDCSDCTNFIGPQQWPDEKRVSSCSLHRLSLVIQIGANGYKEGEWFCKDFRNVGSANPAAIEELESIRSSLLERTLYGAYGKDGNLKEVDFTKLASDTSV